MKVGMIRLSDAFPDLEALYQALPPVPCEGCGSCCVTPHLTLVEFAYLLRHLENNFSQAEMITLLQAPMVPAARFPGNFLCALQGPDGLCRVYPARSLSCRAEGLPVIDSMSGREAPACQQSGQKRKQDGPTSEHNSSHGARLGLCRVHLTEIIRPSPVACQPPLAEARGQSVEVRARADGGEKRKGGRRRPCEEAARVSA